MRLCPDCNKDISHRHGNAIRCEECAYKAVMMRSATDEALERSRQRQRDRTKRLAEFRARKDRERALNIGQFK